LRNDEDENIVLCTVKDCQMGAIHTDCMPLAAERPGLWKCFGCLTSGQ
jgi:hypothetical protein